MSLVIYTDGACIQSLKIGSWAYVILKDNEIVREGFGREENTTSNRMEYQAAINGLNDYIQGVPYLVSLNESPLGINVLSDSELLVKTVNEWMHKWKDNGWFRSKAVGSNKFKGKEIKNVDLVKSLYSLKEVTQCKFTWVKGHSGNAWNEYVDSLCSQALT